MLKFSSYCLIFLCCLWAGERILTGGESTRLLAAPTTHSPSFPRTEAEFAIAKTKSLYIIINLQENLATLKARGITLRSFPVQTSDWIGNAMTESQTFRLKAKDPLIVPQLITPPPVTDNRESPENNDDSSVSSLPPKALTVSDMPMRYTLAFEEQLHVFIQPHHMSSFWDNLIQQMGSWVTRLSSHFSSTPTLVLSMNPIDAQALYWATIPPMPWLLVPETPATFSP